MFYEVMFYDVLKVMDNMKIEKVCLMGYSMGGKVFMIIVLLYVMRIFLFFISMIFLLDVLLNINVFEVI